MELLIDMGNYYYGYSSGLALPSSIVNQMKKGIPHAKAVSQHKEKMGLRGNETWGTYTNGLILHKISIHEAFRNAFTQVILSVNLT